MPQSYTSEYPASVPIDAGIQKFFEEFYKISDTPDVHELYASQFTKDATFVAISKTAKGYDQILETRKGMWANVGSRKHDPVKVFPFGPNSNEVMLYGTVDFVLKDGRTPVVPWAARAVLTKEEGPWKMSFYQVYLDSGALAAARS